MMPSTHRRPTLLAGMVLLCLAQGTWLTGPARAQDLAAFEKRVTEFTLANGLHFIVLERHEAPVAAFLTFANVGAVDEQRNKTGLAHVFEHMAFKGTRTIGTKDYAGESKALARIDALFAQIEAERLKPSPDKARIEQLQGQFKQAQEEAQKYLVHDEFEETLQRAGGQGLNAGTGSDQTMYFVNLPSNKAELWMALESDRFLNPVFREFYKERDVIMEERRRSVESDPTGRLFEEFLGVAYKAHPYGTEVIGHMSDLEGLSRADAEAFFKKYYNPSNLTIAVVGDVEPHQIRLWAEKYFARIPRGPKPEPVLTTEPPQLGERRVTVEDQAQPFVVIGYHKPGINHPDNAAYDAMTDIMGSGRTSRLYKTLVKDKRIAIQATALQGVPGEKYPGLYVVYAVPAKGHTNEECEQALLAEIEKLKTEPVTPEELKKAKSRARAGLIRQLSSNNGLAQQLTYYQVVTGDWRNLFRQLDRIDKVTADDILRVAKETFSRKNRTVGLIETVSTPKPD
jgi:predicted Zn-dependent peptidase